jgi:hypothetical protein
MRAIVALCFAILAGVFCSPAFASCPPYRHTLSNGTVADATQVMDNFNDVLTCMAPLANPSFTGNVGIGTTTPDAKLVVIDTASTTLKLGVTNSPAYSTLLVNNYDAAQPFYINEGPTPFRIFGTKTAIGGDGNLTTYISNYYNVALTTHTLDPTSSDVRLFINQTGNVTLSSLAGSGARTVTADSNGTLSASSDERLKDIVGPYSDGLSVVLALNPIIYKWKPSSGLFVDRPVIGFSAQNVQRAIPAAVGTGKNGYLTLDDRGVLAAAINAIKELKALNDRQAARIALLNASLAHFDRMTRAQEVSIRQLRTEVAAFQQGARVRTVAR